jgi:hypothetical protein
VTFDERQGMRVTIPAEADSAGAMVLGTVGTVSGLAFVLLWCSLRGIAFTKTLAPAVSVPTGWLLVLGGFSAITLAMAASVVLARHSREIIQIDGQTIAMRSEGYSYSFGPRAPQVFPLGDVRNLRYSPERRRGSRGGDFPYGFSIVFDCKRLTGRFGFNLSEPESRRLIKTIRDRYKIKGDQVDSLPVEGHGGNVKTPPEERKPRRRSFPPQIHSRVASDEINGFVITIPNVSNELPTWVVVASCTVAVPFLSLALFGLFAGVIIPILGRPVPLSLFWITTALAIPIAAVLGHREPNDGVIIQLIDEKLILTKKSGFWRWRQAFDVARIRNLRLIPAAEQRIQFDYLGKTYRFGRDLTVAEGLRLIKTINDRYKIADDDVPLPVETL